MILHTQRAVSQFLPFYENKTSTNGLVMMGLKGKVKSIQQRSYKAIETEGKIEKGGKSPEGFSVDSDFNIQFDDSSRTIKEIYLGIASITHRYNDTAKVEVVEESERPNSVLFRWNYKYNNKGKVKEIYTTQILYNKDTYENRTTYKYNETGKLIESPNVCITKPEDTGGTTFYKYDEKGNLISWETLNNGKAWFKESFQWDAKGNIIQHNYFGIDCKTIEHSFSYTYDDHKNITLKILLS